MSTRGGHELPPLLTRTFMQDPYPFLSDLQRRSAAEPFDVNGFRMWLVTRRDDVRNLLADPGVDKDLVGQRSRLVPQVALRPGTPKLPVRSRRSLLDRDGEDHHRLRGAVAGWFTAARVATYEPMVVRTARSLLDRLRPGETVDLVQAYTRPLAATVVAELLGVPPDLREGFPRWQDAMLTGTTRAEIEDGARRLEGLADELVALRRRDPQDDLVTALVRLRSEGVLDEDELVSTVVVMMVGGNEPASALGNVLTLLLPVPGDPDREQADREKADRDLVERVRADRALLERVVEEGLRVEAPFRVLPPRFSARPVHVGDVEVPPGELLLLSPAAANRDPHAVGGTCPHAFDPTREPFAHLSFGHGRHRCVGAALGRLETVVGLAELLDRFPATTLLRPRGEQSWRPGPFMRRPAELPAVVR